MTTTRTARERAREEITGEILSAARVRLRETGPGDLSLRAVARDVGMVSSAVYRYFASRDELLTALLIAAYDDLGAAAEAADEAITDRGDHLGRWRATCLAIRDWSVSHPQDYALLYGSPIAGYAAPQDTIAPATRVIVALVGIVVAAHTDDALTVAPPPSDSDDPSESVAEAMVFVREHGLTGDQVLPEVVVRTLMAWSTLFGTLSFELFGHLKGSVSDFDAYFEHVALRLAGDLGLR